MGLAAVVFKKHAGRAVQLRDNYALGAVDHERACRGHERQFAHVDFLLFHFLDYGLGRRFLIKDDQAHLRAKRRRKGQAALLAFFDIERWITKYVGQKL